TKTTLPREDRRTPGHRDAAPAGQPQRPGGRPGMQNARANDGGNAAKGPRRRRRSNAKMPALPGNRQEPNRPSQGGGKSGSIQGVAFLHREGRPKNHAHNRNQRPN
ncbi:MAG: RNA helicase, partial [Bradyrhizobium sp.]